MKAKTTKKAVEAPPADQDLVRDLRARLAELAANLL